MDSRILISAFLVLSLLTTFTVAGPSSGGGSPGTLASPGGSGGPTIGSGGGGATSAGGGGGGSPGTVAITRPLKNFEKVNVKVKAIDWETKKEIPATALVFKYVIPGIIYQVASGSSATVAEAPTLTEDASSDPVAVTGAITSFTAGKTISQELTLGVGVSGTNTDSSVTVTVNEFIANDKKEITSVRTIVIDANTKETCLLELGEETTCGVNTLKFEKYFPDLKKARIIVYQKPIACTEDAKICPDGTSVVRDPDNNCEFKKCPAVVGDETAKLKALCIESGGDWTTLPNGCGDSCDVARGKDVFCTQAEITSCDCGENMCWDGDTCEFNNVDDIAPLPLPVPEPLPPIITDDFGVPYMRLAGVIQSTMSSNGVPIEVGNDFWFVVVYYKPGYTMWLSNIPVVGDTEEVTVTAYLSSEKNPKISIAGFFGGLGAIPVQQENIQVLDVDTGDISSTRVEIEHEFDSGVYKTRIRSSDGTEVRSETPLSVENGLLVGVVGKIKHIVKIDPEEAKKTALARGYKEVVKMDLEVEGDRFKYKIKAKRTNLVLGFIPWGDVEDVVTVDAEDGTVS